MCSARNLCGPLEHEKVLMEKEQLRYFSERCVLGVTRTLGLFDKALPVKLDFCCFPEVRGLLVEVLVGNLAPLAPFLSTVAFFWNLA